MAEPETDFLISNIILLLDLFKNSSNTTIATVETLKTLETRLNTNTIFSTIFTVIIICLYWFKFIYKRRMQNMKEKEVQLFQSEE
jgi:hypothetical protein